MTKPYRTVIDVRSATQDLTTVRSVKLDLGLDPLDTHRTIGSYAQIKQASSAIAALCNRMFGEETHQQLFQCGVVLWRVAATVAHPGDGNSFGHRGRHASAMRRLSRSTKRVGLLWRTVPGSDWCRGNWLGGATRMCSSRRAMNCWRRCLMILERAANLMIKSSVLCEDARPDDPVREHPRRDELRLRIEHGKPQGSTRLRSRPTDRAVQVAVLWLASIKSARRIGTMLDQVGEDIIVRRYTGTGTDRPKIDVRV